MLCYGGGPYSKSLAEEAYEYADEMLEAGKEEE